jgi:hypothetical protein
MVKDQTTTKILNVDELSTQEIVGSINPASVKPKKVVMELESADDEIKRLTDIVAIPSLEKITEESKELMAQKQQLAMENLQYRFYEAIRIYKKHLVGRVRDCVKLKDRDKMITESDEKKWQSYLALNCPPPDIGGNKELYNLRIEYDRLLNDDRALILKIKGEAARDNVALKMD